MFHITLSQLLDDGDTALTEVYRNIAEYYVQNIIAEYGKRAMFHSYVVSYTAKIERA